MNELDDFIKKLKNVKNEFEELKDNNFQLQKDIEIYYLEIEKLRKEQEILEKVFLKINYFYIKIRKKMN